MVIQSPLTHHAYTVGWICALPLEMAAAWLMMDEIHEDLPLRSNDHNTYILGKIGKHNVVIACLPAGKYGIACASIVATQLLFSFPSVQFGLLVGIGGGIPSSDADIRLGDIVVGKPTGLHGGVVQYDSGKALQGGRFERTGMLNHPPQVLLTALSKLQSYHLTGGRQFMDILAKALPPSDSRFTQPERKDHLFPADYIHVNANSKTCDDCDAARIMPRPSRGCGPVVHYGLIASANCVVKDSQLRDMLGKDLNAYCVEMEAAGLGHNYPCLVIRGICDYADSHKNDDWQGYASAVAAAYAKELLSYTPAHFPSQTQTAPHAPPQFAKELRVPLDLSRVPAVESFVGRGKELESLWNHLKPSSHSRKVAIIHGLGGMGKTQMAVRFARSHKDDFSAIFWLNGKDRGSLLQALSAVLPRLPGRPPANQATNEKEVEQNAAQVLDWLAAEGNHQWLLIFDNVDQYSPEGSSSPAAEHSGGEYDVTEFFPIADHGSIIITSRLHVLSGLGKSFPLQKLETESAVQLLLQTSGISNEGISAEEEFLSEIMTLLNRLDGLPLAITIAGTYMHETGTSVREYLQCYQSSWYKLQYYSKTRRHYQHENVLQAWLVSYLGVKKRDKNAAMLLLLLAHFNNRDIWYELLSSITQGTLHCPSWLSNVVSDVFAFKESVRILIGFSLISAIPQRGSYEMHPVVQDWCLYISSTEENAIELQDLALISIGTTVPQNYQQNYWILQQRLLPHADFALQEWNEDWPGDSVAVCFALNDIGDLYRDQGQLQRAEIMYQRALAGIRMFLGADDIATFETAHKLGYLYFKQNRLEEAEEMYQQALSGREKALGQDDVSTLNTLHCLGILYQNQNKLQEAEHIYRKVLASRENVLGPDDLATLSSLQCIATLYHNQGRLKEAEEMYQRAYRGCVNAVGANHTHTYEVLYNLGILYDEQGKNRESKQMFQQALNGLEKNLSLDHPSTLTNANCLAKIYAREGDQRAEEMYKHVLTGRTRALGPNHPDTLDTAYHLGRLYEAQNKLHEAEEMIQQALNGALRTHGSDHEISLEITSFLGNVYASQGKLDRAKESYQCAFISYEETLGPRHPLTLKAAESLRVLSEQPPPPPSRKPRKRGLMSKFFSSKVNF